MEPLLVVLHSCLKEAAKNTDSRASGRGVSTTSQRSRRRRDFRGGLHLPPCNASFSLAPPITPPGENARPHRALRSQRIFLSLRIRRQRLVHGLRTFWALCSAFYSFVLISSDKSRTWRTGARCSRSTGFNSQPFSPAEWPRTNHLISEPQVYYHSKIYARKYWMFLSSFCTKKSSSLLSVQDPPAALNWWLYFLPQPMYNRA